MKRVKNFDQWRLNESINEEAYTEAKLQQLLKDLKADGHSFSDDEAFDIADGILFDEEGLEDYIRNVKKIQDPQGWLANRIV